jgi:hypothetical protein
VDKSWLAADQPHCNKLFDARCAPCARVERPRSRRRPIGEIANNNNRSLLQLQRYPRRASMNAPVVLQFHSAQNAADVARRGLLQLEIL